jgi:hypothetical protein
VHSIRINAHTTLNAIGDYKNSVFGKLKTPVSPRNAVLKKVHRRKGHEGAEAE